jgi:sodium/hydrogen exchanger-like protein 6/7/sodium/hydrogen exchanger 8
MIIFYSGLIRGPVAYALIQNPEGNELNEGDVHNPVFISQIVTQSTTIFVVIFTTVVIGGSLHYYLDWSFSKIAESSRYSIDHPSMDASDTHLETDDNSKRIPLVNKQTTELKVYMDHKSKSQTWFKRIDENILKPALIYNYK